MLCCKLNCNKMFFQRLTTNDAACRETEKETLDKWNFPSSSKMRFCEQLQSSRQSYEPLIPKQPQQYSHMEVNISTIQSYGGTYLNDTVIWRYISQQYSHMEVTIINTRHNLFSCSSEPMDPEMNNQMKAFCLSQRKLVYIHPAVYISTIDCFLR